MKCPICSERLLPGTERCSVCGYRMPRSSVREEHPPVTRPHRPARPRRRRGCCILLLIWPLILALLTVIFSLTGNVTINVHEDIPIEEPSYDIPTSPLLPEEADEGCFAIEDGAVYFLPDLWDGSPIVNIPETVDGETVTAIGPGCFRDCSNLTTIILPETVVEICEEAFYGCAGLRGLYLPFSMESIGADAFAGCVDLEAICIPAAVTEIAPRCFDDCASLHFIIYEGSFEQWNALYSDYINPFTTAVCLDGSYYHGTGR